MRKNIDERYDNRFISLYRIVSSKTIEYKKEKIDILAIGLSFRLFDIKTNKEVLFNQYPFINEQIGKLLIISENNKKIVNFPTKLHWKNKSEINYILEGLAKLKTAIEKYNIKSIAMPKLGCGLGGLDWNIVYSEITKWHNQLDKQITKDLVVEIYI